MAVENAVEGCVRETYGALVATWQARHARDAEVAAAMASIAADETRHAALSWALAEWIEPKLDARARRRVGRARARAVRDLYRELAREPRAALVEALGVPRAARARALLDGLFAAPW
jgi:hypothetical protein